MTNINPAPFNPGTPDAVKYDPKNEATFRRELRIWAGQLWATLKQLEAQGIIAGSPANNDVLRYVTTDGTWENFAAILYANLPTGNGSWDTGVGTTATIPRALTVGGAGVFGTTLKVGTTTAATGNPALDIVSSFVAGIVLADNTTNATSKSSGMAVRHYTNSEEPVAIFGVGSLSGVSGLGFGGGNAALNTVMYQFFYTAANDTTLTGTQRFEIDPNGNIGLGSATSYGSGVRVFFVNNAGTNPSTNPTGGGILYANGGAGTWRGSGGTVTAFGPA